MAPELAEMLKSLRTQTGLPLAVGFGISHPKQVDDLRELADGVIVGSAIMRYLQELSGDPTKIEAAMTHIAEYASSIAQTAHTAL